MPADYKYALRDGDGPKRSFGRPVTVVLVALILIAIIVYGLYFYQTSNVEASILSGQYGQADKALSRWTWLPLVNGRVN
ncbi:MAG TPA: hypothetical protein VFG11_08650, partial [Acidobacteriota bacterium]|nr:hypothetical protein [Acidobacteriota bacterium]